jgi:putative heme-binding domain-containing protein
MRNKGFSALLIKYLLGCSFLSLSAPVNAQSLDAELQKIPAKEIVTAAREQGDAARGAFVFFQPQMACTKCHTVGKEVSNPLGPGLATIDKATSDESIVESILEPSKVIRKGFESVTVLTSDARTLTGLLVQKTNENLILHDMARNGELTTIAIPDIEEWKLNTTSIMPAGQMNQLNSKQQFLDLVRYLIEIRDGGPERAARLQPAASLLVLTVPEYEKHIDHAGLIGSWNGEALERGEAIYQRVCANCHGTKDQPGSLPTSLRFAEGKFKNGSDPLSMYRTLTHGFGLMTPQTWMVPSQKYDVIHYIRETYLHPHNPTQWVSVDKAYLDRLPKGDTFGPEPSLIEPWSAMDYGPSLANTYEIPGAKLNFAYKGVAVRLDPGAGGLTRGNHWMIFDTDTLRVAAAWNVPTSRLDTNSAKQTSSDLKSKVTEEPVSPKEARKKKQEDAVKSRTFIDYRGIQFNGEHNIHPHIVGEVAFANSIGPGWANPSNGRLNDDERVLGRDGRRYGPLPRNWGQYKGLYHHGPKVVFAYTIGTTEVLESPGWYAPGDTETSSYFLRTFNIGPRDRELVLQVVEYDSEVKSAASRVTGLSPQSVTAEWISADGRLKLRIPAGRDSLRFTVWQSADSMSATRTPNSIDPSIPNADLDLTTLMKGGPPRWPQKLETSVVLGAEDGPFASDVLSAPESNPWLAQMRLTGLDFYPDGRIAVCTWDGDVWLVEQDVPQPGKLRWQRIASGLYQPLGLKIVDEKIHLTCRDQLVVLHDLNGDGETDSYQCLNNDHQVTEHFHEFAMGLQTDADGNFYYAKSGCHGKAAVVPHHGTLLRVRRDGSHTEILANGFRAANGVCLNSDGSFVVTDQEGFWNPKNRINWVTLRADGKPNFYGNMLGYHDVTDTSDAAMVQPLCWITNSFDRSPAELLWVDSNRWGPLNGSLLNLSYGYGKAYLVQHENVHGTMQGGMIELPVPAFPTGVMRGRFHPIDGQLYLCGMFAWAGSATHPGGLYRIRVLDKPMYLPTELHVSKSRLKLTFTDPLDPESLDVKNMRIKTWSLRRTADYGSKHFDDKTLAIRAATLSTDAKTMTLEVDELQPTWCMEIKYDVRGADGTPVAGVIHNTIHEQADDREGINRN